MMNQIIRLALSASLIDRETFVNKVSELMETYQKDPEQMRKISEGIYAYLEDLKYRMDNKAMFKDIVDHTNLPTGKDINELSKAIEQLTKEIHEQNKKSS